MNTRIDEIEAGIYRINTPVPDMPGGFSFNQYLLVDDEPLIFHTGGRRLFDSVRAAIERVIPVAKLRHIAFSHYESDECGSLNAFLAVAPNAAPVCSRVAAMVTIDDVADRPARALGDGEVLVTGARKFTWLDTPHLPHGWETGYLFDATSRTLLCGDLFTQPGAETPPVTETSDIVESSEAFRKPMDYFAHAPTTRALIEKVAATEPRLLACMHGSAYRGDGAKLLRALADRVAPR